MRFHHGSEARTRLVFYHSSFFLSLFCWPGTFFFLKRINGILFDVNTKLNTSRRLNRLAKIWSVAGNRHKVAGNQSIRQTNSHSLWPRWDNFCFSCFIPIQALPSCVLSIRGNMVLTLLTSASKLSLSAGMKKFPDWYVLGNCSSSGVKKKKKNCDPWGSQVVLMKTSEVCLCIHWL